jgi:uncharacterized protein
MSNHIIVRNRRFNNTAENARKSAGAEPIALALYTSLSATFPLGEAFFVRSVVHYSRDIPSVMKADVDAFVRQEALHSREHAVYNDVVKSAGIPVEIATEKARTQLDILERREPIERLAVTAGLEHFTSVFANIILNDPRHLAYCDDEARAMWHWHAVEEIEHKAVAMDVFNLMTAKWSPLKRYIFRCGVMVETMARLAYVVWGGIAETLRVEGRATRGWRLKVLAYLLAQPGLFTAMSGHVLRYFKPGFHPNDTDETELLAETRQWLEPAAA